MAHSRVTAHPRLRAAREPASAEQVRALAEYLLENPVSSAILDSVAGFALILNQDRQVVAVNQEILNGLGLTSSEPLRGLRVGELLHGLKPSSGQVEADAGRVPACRHCGNTLAVVASMAVASPAQPGPPAVRARLRQSGEFQVRSTPVRLGGQDLLVFTLQNISGRQRREALEQVFFHDILNLVEGLDGIAYRLLDQPASLEHSVGQIRDLSCQLAEEIQHQRILLSAEEGGLTVEFRDTRPSDVLGRLRRIFSHHEVAAGRHLEFRPGPAGSFNTDPVLLTRVLVNLVKNALEATPAGGTVTVWQEWQDSQRGFLVENPGELEPTAAEGLFQRGHSTKAARGRGFGTYGARLLGEQFLGGRVGFQNGPGPVTRFFLWLPDPGPCPSQVGDPVEPLFRCPQAPWLNTPPGQGAEPGESVLVIDDSRTVLGLLSGVLARRYRLLMAESGEEGLALAQEFSPDLILLDVLMADMDGYAVCARLKADSRTREIPVLFLTALTGEGDEMRALEAGGIDFIPKPISPAVLLARVRNHLELKRSQDRLRFLSLLDGLTGIANRRRFDQYLELEWQRCARNVQPISVVMGDVDFFKAYNDAYGHGQGDDCLRQVAQVFHQALRRPADLAARYGGEEFVCILPDTDPEGALIVADQIMAGMARLGLAHAHSSIADRVTVSVGVATVLKPGPGQSRQRLVERADQLLYAAKRQGRNRIQSG